MKSIPSMPPMGQAPLIGQREQQQKAAIQAAVSQLSIGIYSQLAVAHISSRDPMDPEPERLRKMARDSSAAAMAYFEGLGVIQRQPGSEGEPNDG